jgi:chromate transporter
VNGRLRELAALFLRLGVTAFGGPAAHIAMMHDEVVRRRGWVSEQRFLDTVGATNLIPGPNSTELAMHLGWQRARLRGLLVAGVCFIAPAAVIVGVLAWAYVRYGDTPEVEGLLYGVKPVVIALVAVALWRLAPTAAKSWRLAVLGVAAGGLYLLGVNELAVMVVGGVAGLALNGLTSLRAQRLRSWSPMALLLGPVVRLTASTPDVGLGELFLVFVKIGSVLYGSGYVLLAFLQGELVDRLGWLTSQQVLDAASIGQVTPGPVFTTATFVGYVVAGAPGAVVATVGIFLPSFVFVGFLGRIVDWMRSSAPAGAALDGINAAALGLMAGVLVDLAGDALVDALTVAVAAVGVLVLWRTKVNSTWLVAAGAALGLLRSVA